MNAVNDFDHNRFSSSLSTDLLLLLIKLSLKQKEKEGETEVDNGNLLIHECCNRDH